MREPDIFLQNVSTFLDSIDVYFAERSKTRPPLFPWSKKKDSSVVEKLALIELSTRQRDLVNAYESGLYSVLYPMHPFPEKISSVGKEFSISGVEGGYFPDAGDPDLDKWSLLSNKVLSGKQFDELISGLKSAAQRYCMYKSPQRDPWWQFRTRSDHTDELEKQKKKVQLSFAKIQVAYVHSYNIVQAIKLGRLTPDSFLPDSINLDKLELSEIGDTETMVEPTGRPNQP